MDWYHTFSRTIIKWNETMFWGFTHSLLFWYHGPQLVAVMWTFNSSQLPKSCPQPIHLNLGLCSASLVISSFVAISTWFERSCRSWDPTIPMFLSKSIFCLARDFSCFLTAFLWHRTACCWLWRHLSWCLTKYNSCQVGSMSSEGWIPTKTYENRVVELGPGRNNYSWVGPNVAAKRRRFRRSVFFLLRSACLLTKILFSSSKDFFSFSRVVICDFRDIFWLSTALWWFLIFLIFSLTSLKSQFSQWQTIWRCSSLKCVSTVVNPCSILGQVNP